MASLAAFVAIERETMHIAGPLPSRREAVEPILNGLRALSNELNSRKVLGAGTASALALLESARLLVCGACRSDEAAALNGADQLSEATISHGGLAGWQIRAITREIDEHLGDKISLATLAETVRLSPSYLCRASRQTFQCSPMQFVRKRRLLAAKRLLRSSSIPLSELALSCGFADQPHFTRVFRCATGETPQRWRRIWQTNVMPKAGAGDGPQFGAYLL